MAFVPPCVSACANGSAGSGAGASSRCTLTRRALLTRVASVAALALSAPVHATDRNLAALVRVRDGVYDLEQGDVTIDVNRAIRLLVRGSDLRSDAERAARNVKDPAARATIIDAAQEAREMLDIATQYYDSRTKKIDPKQARVTAEALARARGALDRALAVFPSEQVQDARDAINGPIGPA